MPPRPSVPKPGDFERCDIDLIFNIHREFLQLRPVSHISDLYELIPIDDLPDPTRFSYHALHKLSKIHQNFSEIKPISPISRTLNRFLHDF